MLCWRNWKERKRETNNTSLELKPFGINHINILNIQKEMALFKTNSGYILYQTMNCEFNICLNWISIYLHAPLSKILNVRIL